MSSIYSEPAVPLAVLAREIVNRDGKRGINVSTIWRWIQRGVRGVKLESRFEGGMRVSSREALQRFNERVTAAANGEVPVATTSKQRLKALEAAERELAAAGI